MKWILFAGILLAAFVCYSIGRFVYFASISKSLIEQAKPYTLMSDDDSVTLLVLGDSTAVGVGVDDPLYSLPALYAKELGATYVENHAVSGAVVGDLNSQIEKATRDSYDHILVQAGANDIIRFHNVGKVGEQLHTALDTLPESKDVVMVTAGNVGGVTLFPIYLRGLYTQRSLEYREVFSHITKEVGMIYVDLYDNPKEDPFVQEPQKYLGADGLHPSREGYALWLEKILRAKSLLDT